MFVALALGIVVADLVVLSVPIARIGPHRPRPAAA